MVTDEELVRRAREGDRDAFGALIERHQPAVLGFALSLIRDLTQAEDVAQESFVKAFEAIGGFEGRSEFRTWVSRIASNLVRSKMRWLKLRRWLSLEALAEGGDWSWEERLRETARGDDDAQKSVEARLALERSMAALTARERETVSLRLEGFELNEIGSVLGIKTGTVKATLFHASKKMKRELE